MSRYPEWPEYIINIIYFRSLSMYPEWPEYIINIIYFRSMSRYPEWPEYNINIFLFQVYVKVSRVARIYFKIRYSYYLDFT